MKGIAFDGGYGVTDVLLSADGGESWREATSGRRSRPLFLPRMARGLRLAAGAHELKVRATNRIGQSQPMAPLWNPPGYMRNVVETVRVHAA